LARPRKVRANPRKGHGVNRHGDTRDILDYFLEEIVPVMQTAAWNQDKATRLYLTQRAKERARAKWGERNYPKFEPKP
jgi:hypothetical protein